MSKLPGNEDHGATECDTSPEENYCTMSNHRLVLRLAANLTLKKRDSNQLRINFLKLPFLGCIFCWDRILVQQRQNYYI
jgi:hypothetical protein